MTEIDYDQDDVKAGMLMRPEVYEAESKTTRSRPRPRAMRPRPNDTWPRPDGINNKCAR